MAESSSAIAFTQVETQASTVMGKTVLKSEQHPYNDSLVHQYGGNPKSGWLSNLPDSWLPYIQLARLSPPAGLFLIYFPHLFGILHAAILRETNFSILIRTSGLMLGGSFFFSNATHTWNDLIDAPLDALVERTRNRPIPRRAISPSAAAVFTATQAISAALFLPYLSPGYLESLIYARAGDSAPTKYSTGS